MSYSVNSVELLGYVGADPETHVFANGDKTAKVRLAMSESWADSYGNKREKTEWATVVFYGGVASIVQQHVYKGSRLYVRGKLATRSWEDRDGNTRYVTEIIVRSGPAGGQMIMLDGRGASARENDEPHSSDMYRSDVPGYDRGRSDDTATAAATTCGDPEYVVDDDEIPF